MSKIAVASLVAVAISQIENPIALGRDSMASCGTWIEMVNYTFPF